MKRRPDRSRVMRKADRSHELKYPGRETKSVTACLAAKMDGTREEQRCMNDARGLWLLEVFMRGAGSGEWMGLTGKVLGVFCFFFFFHCRKE